MEEPLKIVVLNRTNTEDFEQLKELIKKFLINIYVRNRKEYYNMKGRRKNELVNRAIYEFDTKNNLTILSNEDIRKIQKSIDNYTRTAKETINNGEQDNVKTRYYLLKSNNNVIAFQQCQVSKNNNGKVQGWRNSAYIEQEYAGKSGKVIDTNLKQGEMLYSDAIYRSISQWFAKNGVEIERTSTGINMLRNIFAYITLKGFVPISKNHENIFFIKNMNRPLSKETLNEIYNMYYQNFCRTEAKNKSIIMQEIEEDSKLKDLTLRQKSRLANCYLKNEELQLEIQQSKVDELNTLIQEDINNKNNEINYELLQNVIWKSINSMKKNYKNIERIGININEEENNEIILDFFKRLDEEWYFKIRNSSLDTKDSNMSRIEAIFNTLRDKEKIIFQNQNQEGITYDIIAGCFDGMMIQYLLERNVIPRQEIKTLKQKEVATLYDEIIEIYVRLELMKFKEINYKIDINDLSNMQRRYNISDAQMNYIIERMLKKGRALNDNMNVFAVQIIVNNYLRRYAENKQGSIKKLKEYIISKPNIDLETYLKEYMENLKEEDIVNMLKPDVLNNGDEERLI